MEYYDNNKVLLEKTLHLAVANMFRRCRLALAEWDFNESLRQVLQDKTNIKKINDLIIKYDETYELAQKSKIQLNKKFNALYKLNK